MKRLIRALAALGGLALIISSPVLASDVSGATYKGDLTVSNDTYAQANFSVPFTLKTQNLIDQKLIASDCSNVAVVDVDGDDVPFMPAPGSSGTAWNIFVDDIQQNVTNNYFLYTGGTTSGGKLRWFPAAGGMTVADAASLELGANFEIEWKGFFPLAAGSNINLANKESAIQVYEGAGSITASIPGAEALDQNHTAYDSDSQFYTSTWKGQTFTPTVSGQVSKVSLYLKKTNSPTGTITVSIRATSGLLPTGSDLCSTTMLASALTSSYAWYDFTFASPATLTASTLYAIVVRDSADDGTNYPSWGYEAASAYASGQLVYSTNSGASWGNNAVQDYDFKVYMRPLATVAASGLTAADGTYKLTADGTNLKLFSGATELATTALGGISVSDNANGWTFCQNGAMTYVEYIKVTVGGVLRGHWYWENAATFADHSGNSNTATPTFATSPSTADVTATLHNFQSLAQAVMAASTATGEPTILPSSDLPAEPTVTVDQDNWTRLWFMGPAVDILDASDIPVALIMMPLLDLVTCAAIYYTYKFTKDMLWTGIVALAIIGLSISLAVIYIMVFAATVVFWAATLVKRKSPVL